MDEVALIERDKYLRIWEHKEYRTQSPGMMECGRAFESCGMESGQSLIDFGSGTCRAAKWFQDKGLDVMAVDFAPNARENNVPFVEACLWELPETLQRADYGFCTDVMEHIPPEKVSAVLAGIASLVERSAYFRIATRPDVMGPHFLGQPLHMTVMDSQWWCQQIMRHFSSITIIQSNQSDVMLVARH